MVAPERRSSPGYGDLVLETQSVRGRDEKCRRAAREQEENTVVGVCVLQVVAKPRRRFEPGGVREWVPALLYAQTRQCCAVPVLDEDASCVVPAFEMVLEPSGEMRRGFSRAEDEQSARARRNRQRDVFHQTGGLHPCETRFEDGRRFLSQHGAVVSLLAEAPATIFRYELKSRICVQAAERGAGFENVLNMTGGTLAWSKKGFAVDR